MSKANLPALILAPLVLLTAGHGCTPRRPLSEPTAAHGPPTGDVSRAPRVPQAPASTPRRERPATLFPATAAGQQFAAWLEAFNSGNRAKLLSYHERHFPYAVASRDVSSIEREHGLSLGTGGFEPRRFEVSEKKRVVVLLRERNSPQYARAMLEVSPEPPHAVTRFQLGPIPTPIDQLSPAEREARTLDAHERRAALESIAQHIEAHYVFAEAAARVIAALQRKQARGGYDAASDAVDFADALTADLRRFSRDKHVRLHFGPMPPEPKLDGAAPPWVARAGYGFGPHQRLDGNVAHLVIHGFPPLFESERQAIAERLSEIADADAAILDLRDNGGGFPPTVVLMASYFFGAEPVHLTSIQGRDTGQTQEHWTERALRGKRFGAEKPVYVLIGPRTFSGGEGFAYALQAQGRAVVVGEGTPGGAHPTWPYPVAGGFVLTVPFAQSINPITGTNWEGIGVIPDVYAPTEEALETAHRLALEKLGRHER